MPQPITLKPFDRIEWPDNPKPRHARRLLGFILLQAKNDGVSRVAMSVGEDGQASMRYFLQEQWWDMVPAPVSSFPVVFQTIVADTRWRETIPMEGTLTARQGLHKIKIGVRLTGYNAVELQLPA